MTVRRSLWAATAALMLISACARTDAGAGAAPDESAPAPNGSSPDGPEQAGIVLRMIREGGFVPAEQIPGRVPEVSVYADGRIITEGPQIAIYPGPALPNLQVVQASPDRVAELVKQAVAAGVRGGADFGQPGVADAPSTRIDVVVDGQTQSVSVMALNEASPDDPRLTAAQREARTKLAKFAEQLRDLGNSPDAKPYRAERVAALAQPWSAPDDGLPSQPPAVAWPGPALPGEPLSPDVKLGCVTAAGADAAKVLDAAAKASQNTPWTSGPEKYRVTFRPLLPDETGCADLKKAR
jgi:hypothetical protein